MNLFTDEQKNKLFSGKYFLVICSGIAFLYATWAKVLDPPVVAAIVTMVFSNYFNKKNGNGGQ